MNKSKNQPLFGKSKKIFLQIFLLLFVALAVVFGRSYFKNKLHVVMKSPDFKLTNQNRKIITNKDMLGKVYVVEFFFARCPTICPIMNNNLKFINKEINNPDFGIISISIDPDNDTPEFLKEHSKRLRITNPNWHFLTGDRDYIGKIANEFDIYVGDKNDEAESLNHSGMLALVDKDGNVRCRLDDSGVPILYYSGLNYEDPEGKNPKLGGKFQPDRKLLIEDIKILLKE